MKNFSHHMPVSDSKEELSDAVSLSAHDVAVQEVMSKPIRMGRGAETDDIPAHIEGIVIGRLRGISADGVAQVDYPESPENTVINAQSTVLVTAQHIGRNIVLSFLNNDPRYPIILGFMQAPQVALKNDKSTVDVTQDGQRLVLTADKEIELKCGKSSITLTRAGKIIIKGAYVSTHSTGVNRLKGGSIQLN